MRLILLLLIACCFQSCGKERELHVHEKEYEWLEEIGVEKRRILKTHVANLAIKYAGKKGDAADIALAVVDACAVEINEVVMAAAEVKSAERGGGLKRESEVDAYKVKLEKGLRRSLWKKVTVIIKSEREKKKTNADM
jgi:hypothetical protein